MTYVQKQAPEGLTVDQERKILVNRPDYEHYMDMIPMLAVQLDDLPGGNPTDGTCVATVPHGSYGIAKNIRGYQQIWCQR